MFALFICVQAGDLIVKWKLSTD